MPIAFCTQCQREFETTADQRFCDECGSPISQPEISSDTPGGPGIAQNPNQIPSGKQPSLSTDPNLPEPLADSVPNFQQQSSSQHVDIGDKVTNIYNQTVPEEYCAYGGEKVSPNHSYRCPSCGRSPLCVEHFDKAMRQCSYCLDVQSSNCGVCDERVPSQDIHSCDRCQKKVCPEHWGDGRSWCSDCVLKWNEVVAAMDSGDVVVSMGTLIGTDEVELKGNTLTTHDGRPVATIKENTWYVSSKQWHRIKPQLLDREQQAMARFYPSTELNFEPQGNASWNGDIVTWSGNRYQVSLRYPPVFPYRAPLAYIVNPKIEESRHIYPDGHLCLFHKDDKAWQVNTTGATVMSWVTLWLHCYEAWLESGHWPRPEADQMVISPKY